MKPRRRQLNAAAALRSTSGGRVFCHCSTLRPRGDPVNHIILLRPTAFYPPPDSSTPTSTCQIKNNMAARWWRHRM